MKFLIIHLLTVIYVIIFFSLIFKYFSFSLKNIKSFNFLKILFAFLIQILGYLFLINFDPFLTVNNINYGFQFFNSLFITKNLGFSFTIGIDGFSLIFILLTIFIFTLCIFMVDTIKQFKNEFFKILIILYFILLFNFLILDFFLFYILFESSLIPMFFIIGFFGSRNRKIKATFYLFLYTTTTAFLTLICLIYILIQTGSTFYADIISYNFTEKEQNYLFFFIFLTFATKIPIIPFHIWLPEAHVEAPTIGSVILASILLKLGGYGFLRFLIPFFPFAVNFFLPLIYSLAICSIIYASLTTIRQIDLKRIIAYSSIAHMNLVVLGIFSLNNQGIDGSLYLMIGHGIVSTALFFIVGFFYDRFHTKLLRYYGGFIYLTPIFGIFFFIFTLGNIGFPVTSNFIGEFLILIGIFVKNPFITLYAGFGIIVSAIYSFWLYNRLFFGTLRTNLWFIFIDITQKEFYVLLFLSCLMFIFGINSNYILDFVIMNTETFLINYSFIT